MKSMAKACAFGLAGLAAGLALWIGAALADQAPRITAEELAAKLGSPDLVVVDVRTGKDWDAGKTKIKGAARQDPRAAADWAKTYDRSKLYVLYCA
jgi:rhodanese-related sulfurtransferase